MATSTSTTVATKVATTTAAASPIKVGPDLNDSRSPYDKKLYRQITLANGLRVVLISDTNVLNQKRPSSSSSSSSSSSPSSRDGDDGDVIMEEEHHDVVLSHETINERSDENDDEKKSDGIITAHDDDDDDDDDNDDDDDDDSLRKAAAALVVNAGSYDDPEYAQGIAHFLEHMLFMGTSKYPTENAYDSFVSSHGGTTNAYTELEYTLYHFDIPQEHFFRALDMFAQFFVHPLLNEDAMDRELNAIESEFELCRQNDDVRWYQMMGWTGCHRRRGEMEDERGVEMSMNTVRHPMGTFSWGNKYSLKEVPERRGVDMVKELRNFYDTHYYASNMSLVVIGAYSLEELESATIRSFASIPSSPRLLAQQPPPTTINPSTPTPPFPPPTLSRLYRILPTRKRHTLILTFQLPPLQKQYWKSKPCDILAHLMGHEGQGSLLSHLKRLGYATGCCAGVGDSGYDRCRGHCLFSVSFCLTLKGVEMWKDVVTCVYEYIGLLRWYYRDGCDGGLPDYIYEELRVINEVAYKYADEGGADNTVEDLVGDMVKGEYLPEERLLDGNSLFFEFDQDIIKHLLTTYFVPTNARVDLMSSTFGKSSDYDITPPPDESITLPFDNTGDATTTTIHHPLSDDDEPPQIEPLFSTRYWCHIIPENVLDEWNQARSPSSHSKVFHLPMANPFIPTDFSLRPLPPDDDDNDDNNNGGSSCPPPSVVIDESSLLSQFPPLPPPLSPSRTPSLLNNQSTAAVPSSLRLFHLFDRKFRRPIGDLRFLLRYNNHSSSFSSSSLTATVISQLAVSILRDALTNITYQASVCELHASFSSTCLGNGNYGISVCVNGFDNQLTRLLEEVVKGVIDLRSGTSGDDAVVVEEGRFQRCRESLFRFYANDGMGSAKKFCGDIRLRCLMMRGALWSGRSKHKALEELTLPSFQSGISSFLSSSTISIEALYHGNCTPDDAMTVSSILTNLLPPSNNNPSSSPPPPILVHKIPMGIAHTLQLPNKNPKDNNTAVELYYQIGIDDTKRRVIIDVLCHLMVEPFYDELRTKEQWGYDVDVSPRWTFGVVGLSFQVVTSRRRSSEDVITRIDEFLSTFRSTLSSLSNETYIKNIVGLAKNKLQAFDSLEDECSSHWSEIVDRRYNFDSHREDVVCLMELTKEEILEMYDEWLLCEEKRRRLVVCIIGNNHEGDDEEEGDDEDDDDDDEEEEEEEEDNEEDDIDDDDDDMGVTFENDNDNLGDEKVEEFHNICNGDTWGKIYG